MFAKWLDDMTSSVSVHSIFANTTGLSRPLQKSCPRQLSSPPTAKTKLDYDAYCVGEQM